MTLDRFHPQAPPMRNHLSLSTAGLLALLLIGCGGGGNAQDPPFLPSPGNPVLNAVTVGALDSPADPPRYHRQMLVTLSGTGLERGLSLSSNGCAGFAVAAAPYFSTGTQAYYTCRVTAVGLQRVTVAASEGGATLGGVDVDVPRPQVTLTVGNGAAVAGSLVLTLEPALAPITVNNFLDYVHAGWYDGTVFHRHAPGFVLQGGGYVGPLSTGTVPTLKPAEVPIALEVGRGLSNLRHSVAMARSGAPDSATSQFFINLTDNTGLDTAGGGYAVFGNITAGNDLVAAMQAAPCEPTVWQDPGDCLPLPNLGISAAVQTR